MSFCVVEIAEELDDLFADSEAVRQPHTATLDWVTVVQDVGVYEYMTEPLAEMFIPSLRS